MKKILKYFVLLLNCSLLCISISACSLFGSSSGSENINSSSNSSGGNSSSNGNSSTNTMYSVNVVYDDESLNFTFSSTSNINITPRYKTGYVLEGYYTQPNGGGELMVDYLGKTASQNWAQSRANVIYPYYTLVNYDYEFTISKMLEEDPMSFNYNINGAQYCVISLNYDKSRYIYQVCVSNPNIKVNITAYADLRATHSTTGCMRIAMGDSTISTNDEMDKGQLVSTPINLSTNYEKFSTSIQLSASAIIKSKGRYLGIGFMTNGSIISYYTGYAKNIYYTMSFVN